MTDADGHLAATSVWLHKKSASISFTVESVSHPDYDPALNSDPDGDSDGTSIIVYKDGTTAVAGFQFVNEQDDETQQKPRYALDAIARVETIDVGGGGRKSLTLDYESIASQFGENAQLMVRFGDDIDLRPGDDWELGPPQVQADEIVHTLRQNGVEVRIGNGRPWTNPLNPVDVTYNDKVEPFDALQILNLINRGKGGDLGATDHANATALQYYDTTGDGSVGPIDVLQVINALNRGESVADSLDTDQSAYPLAVSSHAVTSSRTAEDAHDEALLALVEEQESTSTATKGNGAPWKTANHHDAAGAKANPIGFTAGEDTDEATEERTTLRVNGFIHPLST